MSMVRPGVLSAASAAILALGVGAPRVARAADGDVATAQVLFDDARQLVAQHRYTEACPKLEESQRIAPAIGTEFNLADCWEHTGKLASAWAAFLDVAEQTHARGEAERERVARQRAAAIEPKMARLTVAVGAPQRIAGLELRRDGQVVREALWGVGVPVDAGEHAIEAHAPGREAWSTSVKVADGQAAKVALPELAPASASAAAPAPVTASAPAASVSAPVLTPASAQPESPSPNRTPALVVLGASVVLAGVGALALIEHDAKVSDYNADSTCPSIDAPSRPAHCQDLVNAADTWKTLAIVGFVGAGVGLATGAVLWLTAPRPSAPGAVALHCGFGIASVDCHGAF